MQSRMTKWHLCGGGVLLAALFACTDPIAIESETTQASSTSDAIILEWNQLAVETIGATPPFPSTRAMATVQVAVFEAVNAITERYEPYLGTIHAPSWASTKAAAVTAAHGVLKSLFPAAAANLDARRDASLATIANGSAKTAGITAGEAAAAAMIANRTNDGSAPPVIHTPPNANPYEWQLTPGCAGGLFAHWPGVKPFGVQSSSQFRAPAPPALTSARYATDLNEVKALGDIASALRPQDRANVARLYAAQPPHEGWNHVARQIAATRHDDISRTARVLAILNMSLSDAHITVFESKYLYRTWRPVTSIPRADEDGNAATAPAAFTPFITTPCFPAYPSAHGAGAGAGSSVLKEAYGDNCFSIDITHPAVPGVVLHYTDLDDIVHDVSDARVYGGIHYRYDQDFAEAQGTSIGRFNYRNRLERDD